MKQIKCVIFDFGGVIGLPHSEPHIEEMVQLTGVAREQLMPSYFQHRRDYDQGLSDTKMYWTAILAGTQVQPTEALVEQLRLADAASWTQINPKTVDFIYQLKASSIHIALLSNINTGVVPYVEERFDWLKAFDDLFYSCDLKLLKPDPEIYRHVADTLALDPSDCLFIDDSLENVAGARAIGMFAEQFVDFEGLKKTIEEKYQLIPGNR